MIIKDMAFKTNIGKVRNHNEDSFYADKEKGLFIVADGMGGYQSGEIASKTAVNSIVSIVNEIVENAIKIDKKIICEILQKTNRIIFKKASDRPALKGMGTTIVLAIIRDHNAIVAHVGDSRAYLIRNEQILRLTGDHSIIGEMLKRGLINEEEARVHRMRHIIMKTLGTSEDVKPDVMRMPLRSGDYLLLCTDGLSGMLTDQIILSIIENGNSADKVCDDLVTKANESGGIDNITVILVAFS